MAHHLVWFKKDLRVADHAPLSLALQRGKTVGLFIIEPEWLQSPEFDPCHYAFLEESLRDLQEDLRAAGVPLLIECGEPVEVLNSLHARLGITALYSHEETGLFWTYQRDKRVKRWVRDLNLSWREFPQFGVVRPLRDRDHWARLRSGILERNPIPAGVQPWPKEFSFPASRVPALRELSLPPSEKKHAQKGGRKQALRVLDSFLEERGLDYFASLSSPSKSVTGCSRISAYLTWGNLSLTEALHRLARKRESLGDTPLCRAWRKNLDQFESRLAWHCHFIQKLESEPEIEFQNMNRSFDGMRENEFNEESFEAWCKGETGFPIIDAGMRSLKVNGWINFRMRAALMSFASYQLWLHWRRPAQYLAKQFVDFEPGIHFSQAQMQSGVTGINTIRIYSPKKQTEEKDPEGRFIRRHCPELAGVPPADLAEPHLMPPLLAASIGFVPGKTYPEPIVDPDESYRRAKERIFDWMNRPSVRQEARTVFQKHGSRARRKTSM